MTRAGLRICLIASARFPVAEPFAGGLEAHTHLLASELVRRGHQVSLFAGPGSDPALPVTELSVGPFRDSAGGHGPAGSDPDEWMREHHAYLHLMAGLGRDGHHRFDVIHNNSLHHLPVAMAAAVRVPMLTSLHTPALPWLESAIELAPPDSVFVAVSTATRAAWSHVVDARVVTNGVDTVRWALGPGGPAAVWSGRIVPEKAPHEAIDAARAAGLNLRLAGPILDHDYFAREVERRLGPDVSYVGHLDQRTLCAVVGTSRVALVTPDWDEPYGLVAAEAMACGTPVAAYARGGLPEVVGTAGGRLARAGDVLDLARAVTEASDLDRTEVRAAVLGRASVSRMVDDYVAIYDELSARKAAA
ncbi:glycosyltransferase [Nocardioides bigeumensis]|uniref:Glycosyltransferase family 4 protein n=1 Tax=Nocardioides bigeumensis TaxID=433657 RepID=A0ABN2Y3Z3_9ACTN